MGAAPQLKGALLGRQQLERGQLGVAHTPERRPAHHLALVHEPAKGAQDALRLQKRRGVALHVAHHAPGDDSRLRPRVHARRLADKVGLDAADGGHALGRVLRCPCGQLVETEARALHEGTVAKPLRDDDVGPPQRERRVGAVADAQVVMRALRRGRLAGIDLDEHCPALERRVQRQVLARPALLVAILPEVDDAVGPLPIGAGEPAVHSAVDLRGVAHAQGHRRRVVRRAQAVHKAAGDAAEAHVQRHLRKRHGLGPVRVDHPLQPCGYLVERLVPRHLLPLRLTALAHVLQRHGHAIRMQPVRVHHVRLRADGRKVRVGRQHAQPIAVDLALDLAAPVAEHAGRILRLHGSPSHVAHQHDSPDKAEYTRATPHAQGCVAASPPSTARYPADPSG